MELADIDPRFHKMHASLHLFSLLDYYNQKEALGLCFLKTLTTGISLFKAFICLSVQQGVSRVSVLRTLPYLF